MQTDSRGELLSFVGGVLTTVATWRSDSLTFDLRGKRWQGTLEGTGLRLTSATLANDLQLAALEARTQQAHVVQKRREDVRLLHQDLQALERKLRQPLTTDEGSLGDEVVRLNQTVALHERELERLSLCQLRVTYTETTETTTLVLPAGVFVSVPELAGSPLLWCPTIPPTITRHSELRIADVEFQAPILLTPCATYKLPQPGRQGTLRRAAALCASDGLLHVLEQDGGNLWSFDLKSAGPGVPRVLGKKRLLRSTALATVRGRFYATDTSGLVVINGGFRPVACSTTAGTGEHAYTGAAAAGDTLFVADRARHVVQVWSVPEGLGTERLRAEWGSRGSAPGQFQAPAGLAYADHQLWVADSQRVQVLDARDGRAIARWGAIGTQAGALYHPRALAVCRGLVFVTDRPNGWRLQAFTLAGQFVCDCRTDLLTHAPALAACGDLLFVSGYKAGHVQAFRVNNEPPEKDPHEQAIPPAVAAPLE